MLEEEKVYYYRAANDKLYLKNNQYFRNEKQLRDEEKDKGITASDFKELVRQAILPFINKNYNQIILLAGAGASITGLDGEKRVGKSMEDLSDIIKEELNSKGYFNLDEMVVLSKYDYVDDFSLEDLISNCESALPYIATKQSNKFSRSLEKIYEVIRNETDYSYNSDLLDHAGVINRLAQRITAPNKLTIATTNYDTLFEEASAINDYSIMDGFTYDSRPYFDPDMFDWNLVRDVPNLATAQLEYKKNVINLIKLHGSLTWERSDDRVLRKDKSSIKKPLMIFPSSNKYMQSYTEPYFELFSKFQELINRPDTLLISNGFSFGDNHISEMIYHAVTHNNGLSALVTDFNITTQQSSGWLKLQQLARSGYPIRFLKATMNELSFYFDRDLTQNNI